MKRLLKIVLPPNLKQTSDFAESEAKEFFLDGQLAIAPLQPPGVATAELQMLMKVPEHSGSPTTQHCCML